MVSSSNLDRPGRLPHQQGLCEALPPPMDVVCIKALDLFTKNAPLMPMIEMMNDQDLRGALSHAMSMPVLRLLAENNEATTRKILKKLLLNKSVRSHLEKLKAPAETANQEPL